MRNRCLNMLNHRSVKERAARLLLLEAQPSVAPVDVEIAHIDEVFSFMESQLTPQTLQVMRLRFVHLSCRNMINYAYICSYNNRKR